MGPILYSCNCGQRHRILLNRLNDATEVKESDKAIEQTIDSAWEDGDVEFDRTLVAVLHTLKGTTVAEENLENMLQEYRNDRTSLIFSSLHLDNRMCCCQKVSHKLSIILNMGLAELLFQNPPNEQRLLEILEQIEPFVDTFKEDAIFDHFLQDLWNFSMSNDKRALICKLTSVSPENLNALVERILSEEREIIFHDPNFSRLAAIVVIPEVFRHVSYYLAGKKTDERTEKLLKAILKTVKLNLPTKKFLGLYPLKLSSIAILMNEVLNPADPLILKLLEQVKSDCYLDFVLLVTHFPIFLHFK
ncbi:uncharacterized protein LOC129776006 [Toxorhynchites rutilus septentrionalis]|uniref:uncharacterized protein LOC129776006 n=1 Tax=Toxorhynchites rutilus septentrionalis TaxID=329112 RepID=UPI00247B2298|nr:uncharacterized protein LOC129776006 [Toxorhynchites rutilus septentrionalis]